MDRKIIVATDGSDSANRAVDHAAGLSEKLDRALCIVHVLMHGRPAAELVRLAESEHLVGDITEAAPAVLRVPVDDAGSAVERDRAIRAVGEQILGWAKRRASDAGARNVTGRLGSGDYAEEILDAARAEDAGMIVLGNRGLGRIKETLLGSVSQKVLHHADCPVVIVP